MADDSTPEEEDKTANDATSEDWSGPRRFVYGIVASGWFTHLVMCVIFSNVAFLIVEADQTAEQVLTNQDGSYSSDGGGELSVWLRVGTNLYTIFYTIEIALRLYAYQWEFFHVGWQQNVFDLCVVLADLMSILLQLTVGTIPSLSILRLFRIAKVMRAMRSLSAFREFYLLITGFVSAMKAVFWASLMIGAVLLAWALLAVIMINPINVGVVLEGKYGDCERCPRAFGTCWKALITLVQTLIAGDSWGTLAVPIIEHTPITLLFFATSMLSIQLGIMNLVVGCVVDNIDHVRSMDEQQLLRDKIAYRESSKVELGKLCSALDLDQSGNLTLQELLAGYDSMESFRNQMSLLDIERSDLEVVYHILDQDQSGDVNYDEFVVQLHRLKSQDTHTLLVFLRYHVDMLGRTMSKNLRLLTGDLNATLAEQHEQLSAITATLRSMRDERALPTANVPQAVGVVLPQAAPLADSEQLEACPVFAPPRGAAVVADTTKSVQDCLPLTANFLEQERMVQGLSTLPRSPGVPVTPPLPATVSVVHPDAIIRQVIGSFEHHQKQVASDLSLELRKAFARCDKALASALSAEQPADRPQNMPKVASPVPGSSQLEVRGWCGVTTPVPGKHRVTSRICSTDESCTGSSDQTAETLSVTRPHWV
eukprot:NODE_2793_length_2144_cov_8.877541.p1 GENE.NODE_2793_length_2144_cov_8.877541~~NODE_2793_length_2144_cov_8.877541.p1  ORF type:complete len:652 (+),score=87.18 NODE_2793_length_2144_cov_8.877541:69-2024(+)